MPSWLLTCPVGGELVLDMIDVEEAKGQGGTGDIGLLDALLNLPCMLGFLAI
jgi:hypothetical protein